MYQVEKHIIAIVTFVISIKPGQNILKAEGFTLAVVVGIPSGLLVPPLQGSGGGIPCRDELGRSEMFSSNTNRQTGTT